MLMEVKGHANQFEMRYARATGYCLERTDLSCNVFEAGRRL